MAIRRRMAFRQAVIACLALLASGVAQGAEPGSARIGAAADQQYQVQTGMFHILANAQQNCAQVTSETHPFVLEAATGRNGHPVFYCRSAQHFSHAAAAAVADQVHREAGLEAIVVAPQSAAPRSGTTAPRTVLTPPQQPVEDAVPPNLRQLFEHFIEETGNTLGPAPQ